MGVASATTAVVFQMHAGEMEMELIHRRQARTERSDVAVLVLPTCWMLRLSLNRASPDGQTAH